MGAAESEGALVTVGEISPAPAPEMVAAITVAVLEAWPKPSRATPPEPIDVRWRFGQRRWTDRTTPRRTWGV